MIRGDETACVAMRPMNLTYCVLRCLADEEVQHRVELNILRYHTEEQKMKQRRWERERERERKDVSRIGTTTCHHL